MIKKLAVFLKPYRATVIAAVMLVFLQSFTDLLLPKLMAEIVDAGVVRGDRDVILRVGILMIGTTLIGAAAAASAAFLSAKSSLGFGRDLRRKVFERVEGFSLREFDSFGTSTLITRTTNDVGQLQNVVLMSMHMMTRAPLMAIGSLTLAFATDARLTLVLIASLPFLVAAVVLISKKGLPLFRVVQDKTDALNRVLREGLTGIRVVRAFNRETAERERFARANEELTNVSLQAQRIMAIIMPVMMILMNLASVAVVWFGGLRVNAGALGIGQMMAFLQYATHMLFSFMILSNMFVMLPRAAVSAGRVLEVLETAPSIVDAPQVAVPGGVANADARAVADGVIARVAPRIEFRDVYFKYPGAEAWALSGIGFSVRGGETVAIIGGTGSGKTSLLSLILRFYDPQSGVVTVDGRDVRSYDQADLRARMGYAPQNASLFVGDIGSNIRYGKEAADQEEVREAARIAQASDFIDALPEGFSATVAQGGSNFSGGQKQRLSIARALIRSPSVYLFDDSFSALDLKTDARLRAELQASIRAKNPDAAVLIVAQRVGTVVDADRIVVLDEGRIAGIGTHAELLTSCAVYQEIAESQLGIRRTA